MPIPFVAVPSFATEVEPARERHAEEPDAADERESADGRGPADEGRWAGRPAPAEESALADEFGPADGRAATQEELALDVSTLGPLARFAAEPGVTDLFVNGEAGLWVDDGTKLRRRDEWQADERQVRQLAVRLIALGGRHIDEASPCVDVRLADGIRVHAALPPVSSTGTLVSIRLPRAAGLSLDRLVAGGLCGEGDRRGALRDRLRTAVTRRENLLITGAAGTGKTTLLAALLGEAPVTERIVVIEDVAELRIAHPHVVALESRQPNLEGAGRIGVDALVREALRMRPDRLVLGECRGAEIRDLLGALNTGHDGGAGTLHANSLADVPARLEALGALAGLSTEGVARQTVSAFDLVLHLERRERVRRIAAVGRFAVGERGSLAVEEVAVNPGVDVAEAPSREPSAPRW